MIPTDRTPFGSELTLGDHLCWIYETDEEHRAVVVPFLRGGLERGERVVYVADARSAATILSYLEEAGVVAGPHLKSGQLAVLTAEETYLQGGSFDPDRMIALLRRETDRAVGDGFAGLRATGEMSWALRGSPGSERLMEYEARLNTFFPASRCVALWQYDRRRFPPDVLLDVLFVHPMAVVGTKVCRNDCYVDPGGFLGPERSGARLQAQLSGLLRRKESEEALRQSEERFSKAFHASPASSTIRRISDWRLLEANETFERLTGYTREEAIGRTPRELGLWVDPKDRERMVPVLLSEGRVWDREIHLRTRDGKQIIGQYSAALIEIGGEACSLATVVDITERKRAEIELRESEERYRLLYEGAPVGYQSLDADGRILDVNTTWLGLLGYAKEEVLGRWFGDLVAPAERPAFIDRFPRFLASGVLHGQEVTLLRKDGSELLASFEGRIARDAAGHFRCTHCVLYDVTERKRAEEALRESEQRFRTIFDRASDGMFVLDLETRKYVMCNPTCSRMLGVTQEEFLNSDISDLHPPEDVPLALEQVGEFMKGGTGVRNDIQFRRKDGTVFFADLSPASVTLAGRESILVVFKDISERKGAEAELRGSREQLRALAARIERLREEERTRIAQEIHDDLGHALTALKTDITRCGKKTGALLAPAAREALARSLKPISDSVDRMAEAVRRIATELRPAILDHLGLGPAVEWLAQQFQSRTGIACFIATCSGAVELDPRRSTELFRMLQELLTNVMRHARATMAAITLEQQGGSLTLDVRDDGIGIAESQVADAGSLGLLGLRERARLLGGEFTICGSPGKGTTATVRIPVGP